MVDFHFWNWKFGFLGGIGNMYCITHGAHHIHGNQLSSKFYFKIINSLQKGMDKYKYLY